MAEKPQGAEPSTQADIAELLPVYEVGFHLVPQVGDDGVAPIVDKIRKALGNAEIISEGFPAKMSLAYTIERADQGKREKFSEAYFGFIKFAAPSSTIAELEEALKTPQVLRHLIIHTTREDLMARPTRAVFTSDRLEGQTIAKPAAAPEKAGEVSQEELDKSIESLVTE